MQFLDSRKGAHPFHRRDASRPHIFVFTMDMVAPEFYRRPSPYAAHLHKPAWDRLEQDSVCFDNAFSVSPLCGPSRAALFTGRYPYILVNEERAHDGSEVEVRPDDPIYPQYLRKAGYKLGHVGKSHIGTEKFMQAFGESCSPWNRWAPPLYDDPEYHQYLKTKGIGNFRVKREIRGLRADRRTAGNHYGGWIEQADGRDFPVEGTYPHYLVDRALATLDSLHRRQTDGGPLYLHVDLFAPHQPFMIPAGMEQREAELRKHLTLPDGYVRWLNNGCCPLGPEPGIYEMYRRNWGLYDEETAYDYLIAHILQMEVIDLALARFVQRLQEWGLYDDSVLIFTADHGEMNLEQGLIDKGVYGHPKVARVPLLFKQPGNQAGGRKVDQPVCLLDVAPTLLQYAGIEPLARLDGESLLRRLSDQDRGREKPVVFEAGWHIAPNPAVAIHWYRGRDTHYRYVYNLCSDVDELYDLNDPEARNRIDDPALSTVRKQMIVQMRDILNGDPRWRCYRQAFELEKELDLPSRLGDNQMFIPE